MKGLVPATKSSIHRMERTFWSNSQGNGTPLRPTWHIILSIQPSRKNSAVRVAPVTSGVSLVNSMNGSREEENTFSVKI